MSDVQEPDWLDITSFATGGFEVQLDERAARGSQWQYRHRPYAFTGEAQHEWMPGEPPKE